MRVKKFLICRAMHDGHLSKTCRERGGADAPDAIARAQLSRRHRKSSPDGEVVVRGCGGLCVCVGGGVDSCRSHCSP